MFQIDPLDLANALGEEVTFDIYPVVVAAAQRSSTTPHLILLLLEIFGGYHDGVAVQFNYEEPHEGQSGPGLRKCLRTLFALGVLPADDGRYDYGVSDLVRRRCWAKLSPVGGVPRVLHDGLLPND